MNFDPDGQPAPGLNETRRITRALNELVGVIRGILADGMVTDAEVFFLGQWVQQNGDVAGRWPIDVIVAHLTRIFDDGTIDAEERTSLKELLESIVGQTSEDYWYASTDLPLTKPEPEIIFDQNVFVLTGRFAFGPRRVCEKEVHARGGLCSKSVTLQTNYLVIGSLASRDWIQSAWGRKIESAQRMAHGGVAIVSEETWSRYLLPYKHPTPQL